MLTHTALELHKLLEPDHAHRLPDDQWVTHAVEVSGLDLSGNLVRNALWRLRVSLHVDDRPDANPWSYVTKYWVEVSSQGTNGTIDWCPISVYLTHDEALACIERQAKRMGINL